MHLNSLKIIYTVDAILGIVAENQRRKAQELFTARSILVCVISAGPRSAASRATTCAARFWPLFQRDSHRHGSLGNRCCPYLVVSP